MPLELVLLRYREKMGIAWNDLMATPWWVVAQDLEIMGIESDVIKSLEKHNSSKLENKLKNAQTKRR